MMGDKEKSEQCEEEMCGWGLGKARVETSGLQHQ